MDRFYEKLVSDWPKLGW